jgi:LmbE family N-acetylglucosaminyl deacetylase
MLLFVISVACFAAPRLRAQLESTDRDTGWVGLELALRRLQTTVSVLFVTAHPDDENNALLAYLSQGRGCRVGILTLTRGAGGQNEIGPELGDALAILRTEELIAVHRHDKVEQRFGRVVDFGYSFSVDETLEKWGAEETLEDIVRVVRDFRPDVMITMRPDGAGGGQHHQTSARLAEEAFEISGDVRRFPHHVDEGLRPWKPRQLYRAPFRLRETETPDALAVPVGEFDLALGKSFAEFGAAVRNLHRSQGMNAPPTLLSTPVWLLPVVPAKVPVALAGLPWGLERLTAAWEAVGDLPPAELLELVETADEVAASFRAGNWGSTTTGVMRGLAAVTALEAKLVARKEPASEDVRSLLTEERKDWLAAAEVSHQFACVARVRVADADQPPGQASGPTADGLVTAGETFVVETTVVKRAPGRAAVRRVKVSVPTGWTVEAIDGQSGELETGRARTWNHRVTWSTSPTASRPRFRGLSSIAGTIRDPASTAPGRSRWCRESR